MTFTSEAELKAAEFHIGSNLGFSLFEFFTSRMILTLDTMLTNIKPVCFWAYKDEANHFGCFYGVDVSQNCVHKFIYQVPECPFFYLLCKSMSRVEIIVFGFKSKESIN